MFYVQHLAIKTGWSWNAVNLLHVYEYKEDVLGAIAASINTQVWTKVDCCWLYQGVTIYVLQYLSLPAMYQEDSYLIFKLIFLIHDWIISS